MERGELLVGILITEKLLRNKCVAITEASKRLICEWRFRGNRKQVLSLLGTEQTDLSKGCGGSV